MRFILIVILFTTGIFADAQPISFKNKAKIYLVRHAEKLSGEDPYLTEEGNKRAGDLMRTLRDKKIKRIYVTLYKRTQNTSDSLRIQLGIDTVHYFSDTTAADLIDKIRANKDTRNAILIIGHSNTIPIIIRKLGITDYPVDDIPVNEFDNLFLLTFRKGKASLEKTKYGASSSSSSSMHD